MESLAGEINYEKIDVDNNQDLSIQYGVRNIPTLRFSWRMEKQLVD